jgi:LysM repeat protein
VLRFFLLHGESLMRRPISRIFYAALFGAAVLWFTSILPRVASAQVDLFQTAPTELLQNPGFEGTYAPFNNDDTRLLAPGWLPWHLPPPAGAQSFVNTQPSYRSSTARVHGENVAQEFFTFTATYDGGVYQQVAVAKGTKLQFSAWVNVWSSANDDPARSDIPGQVKVQVGIDPAGGTDGAAAGIVWSEPVEFYDQWRELTVTATSTGDTGVTVFVRSAPMLPAKHNNTFVDDASLKIAPDATATPSPAPATETPAAVTATVEIPTVTAETPIPTLEPTATIAATIAATAAATETANVPSATPTSAETQPATVVLPTLTETQPATLTETPVATGTSTPTAAATIAATSTATPLPTLTPVPPSAIASSTAIVIATIAPPTIAPTIAPPTALPTQADATFPPTLTPVGTLPPPTLPFTPTPFLTPTPFSAEFPYTFKYTVQYGNTLSDIAAMYNSSVEAIVAANRIEDPGLIIVGQVLDIPTRTPPLPTRLPIPPTAPYPPNLSGPTNGGIGTYIVQPGDDLSKIAALYRTSPWALAKLNGILNPNLIRIGQILVVPGPGNNVGPGGGVPPPVPPAPQRTHIIQFGETLYSISIRYGVPLEVLMRANGIYNPNRIYVGQILHIP